MSFDVADPTAAKALSAWQTLAERIEARFAEIAERHGEQMQCAAGCSACCQPQLGVSVLEAIALVRALEAGGQTIDVSDANTDRCALLRDDKCQLYAARPLICRSHGLPVAQRSAADIVAKLQAGSGSDDGLAREQEGVEVSVCQLNFRQHIPTDAIIDGGSIEAALAVADHLLRERFGLAPMRILIDEIARLGRAALPDALHGLLAAKIGDRETAEKSEPPQGGSAN
ncbi:MAG: YkgJ family cysteine cluster protein [Myxococcales bacterium]|nr:YkgJ family cysteine cluster protein [Myxococcales bacterium]